MRDRIITGKRDFINLVDSGNNNNTSMSSPNPRDYCPNDQRNLVYSQKSDIYYCPDCGYGYREPRGEEQQPQKQESSSSSFVFSTSDHYTNDTPKGGLSKETTGKASDIFVIPMDQHRNARNRRYTLPEWTNPMTSKGYNVVNYSENIIHDRKSFNPSIERDSYYSDRQHEQRVQSGDVLSTSNPNLENRKRFVKS